MATIRQQIAELLRNAPWTARELSQRLRISEKQVVGHLDHIARTVSRQGHSLRILPIRCLNCGYVFRERSRYTPPSRCPRCRKSHIEEMRYEISPGPKR